MDDKKYMSRKFGMACFVLLVAIPLLILDHITGENYVSITALTLGLYFTGNVVSEFVTKK